MIANTGKRRQAGYALIDAGKLVNAGKASKKRRKMPLNADKRW